MSEMECPKCKKAIRMVLGNYPDYCPFCGAYIESRIALLLQMEETNET